MDYILITGGTGYIGSNICIELYKYTRNIIVIDNYSNSFKHVENNIKKFAPKIIFLECNLLDKQLLTGIFVTYKISSVIHLAGLKSIKESIKNPLLYYNNNISGTLNLLNIMQDFKCFNLIFSSSATVYGNQNTNPISETAITSGKPENPYGSGKLFIETVLKDIALNPKWKIIILRYFNPVGCHSTALIGEIPKNTPSNLFPYILGVYNGIYPYLNIFGNNYNTKDGTCIRDYIHIEDLASAHVCALDKIIKSKILKINIYNIGTGIGYSVLDIVNCFNKYSKHNINTKICEKRTGDTAICYADNTKALNELNWIPNYNLDKMVCDSLKWADKANKAPYTNNYLGD